MDVSVNREARAVTDPKTKCAPGARLHGHTLPEYRGQATFTNDEEVRNVRNASIRDGVQGNGGIEALENGFGGVKERGPTKSSRQKKQMKKNPGHVMRMNPQDGGWPPLRSACHSGNCEVRGRTEAQQHSL